jgi:hypothetical protein
MRLVSFRSESLIFEVTIGQYVTIHVKSFQIQEQYSTCERAAPSLPPSSLSSSYSSSFSSSSAASSAEGGPSHIKVSHFCRENKLKGIDRSFELRGEIRLIRSVMKNWRLGNFFYFILKGHHHKISKKPIDAA